MQVIMELGVSNTIVSENSSCPLITSPQTQHARLSFPYLHPQQQSELHCPVNPRQPSPDLQLLQHPLLHPPFASPSKPLMQHRFSILRLLQGRSSPVSPV